MEETKCYCGHTTYCDCGPEEPNPFELPKALSDDVFYKSLEPNQESLEEVAEKYAEIYRCPATNDNEYCRHDVISAINFGAKWQQEQEKNKYSEEDMKLAFCNGGQLDYSALTSTQFGTKLLNKWFEQFKKK